MMVEPRIGDAFGEMLRTASAEELGRGASLTVEHHVAWPTVEVVEWGDGMVSGGLARFWFAGPASWLGCERRALRHIEGDVLDVGAGAGRVALALQERGHAVTALDTSPGAVDVARRRGVTDAVCATVDGHVTAGQRYDTFAFFGANLGLLESRERAPVLLAALGAMANPGARVVGQIRDPHVVTNRRVLAYQERNIGLGRLPGQVPMRVRFRDIATPWADFLACSVAELARLLGGTGWELSDVDDGDTPIHSVALRLRR